jgi:glycerophosphoryl diester phosphodiesterase
MNPVVIAHRGASGHRPEHTLEGYRLAAGMGADYLEPDLVATSDGVLVARHENEISETTDVADHPEFASRRTAKVIDGAARTGWFTEDFTLAELRTLRARERIPHLRPRNTDHDGAHAIPTFEEVIELARELGRGIYPETKHPGYFRSIGLPLEEPLVESLRRFSFDGRDAPVFVQSFGDNLPALRAQIDTPLIQLLNVPNGSDPFGTFGRISEYADGVGPSKELIVPRDGEGRSLEPTSFVDEAHAAGLLVHAYTFRSENAFLPLELRRGSEPAAHGDALAEYEQFYALGVDGVFSDFPETAVAAR